MCLSTNVLRRNGTYTVRLRVPRDLIERLGKRAIWRSLRTSDPAECRLRAPRVIAELQQFFSDEREAMLCAKATVEPAVPGRAPTAADILGAARTLYERELRLDHQTRLTFPTRQEFEAEGSRVMAEMESGETAPDDIGRVADVLAMRDAAEMDRTRREALVAELRKHAAVGETTLIEWAADEAIERAGWTIEKGSGTYRELCHRLTLAWLEALTRAQERDHGRFDDTPSDPALAAAAAPEQPQETIGAVAAEFMQARPDMSAEYDIAHNAAMRWFLDFVGRDTPVKSIGKREVRAWVAALRKFPSRGSLLKENEGATFQEIVARNEVQQRPVIAPRTVNKNLSIIAGFMDWMVNNDYIESNPTEGQRLPKGKPKNPRDTFTVAQLQTLFNSPLYTGCLSAARKPDMAKPGNVRVGGYAYWVPLLGVWTGARSSELLNLRVGDIQQIDGVWCFRIHGTKTDAAERIVPVHPELEKLGFMAFVAKMKADGHEQLFPDAKGDSLDRLGSRYSKEFSDYIERVGIKSDTSLVFHSLRHTFVDELRRRGYADTVIAVFVGHEGGSVTSGYGKLPQFSPAQRLEIIRDVKHDGLRLDHLYGLHNR